MRKPQHYTTAAGSDRYKVRYRLGGTETSETFRTLKDANTFSAVLDGGGVTDALAWLKARQTSTSDLTFAEFFEIYVDQLTGITVRTRDDYRAQKRRYLTELDHLPVALIARSHVTSIVNRLEREGRSPKTIKNAIHMLSSCLALALDEGHIPRNVTRRVRLPKARLAEAEERFLTIEEAGQLILATDPHYQPLVTFLLGSGLRWSEATALQTRHVDLEAGTVRVQRAWKRIPGGWEVGPPKSSKANRTVNAAVPALIALAGQLGKPNDLVFTTPTGKPVRHANFYNRIWLPACERSGIEPRPTIHACRHTFASWLISDGIGLEAVQDQLGHESYETTRRVYAKLLPAVGIAAGRSASAAMQRVLANRLELGPPLPAEPVQSPQESARPADVTPDARCCCYCRPSAGAETKRLRHRVVPQRDRQPSPGDQPPDDHPQCAGHDCGDRHLSVVHPCFPPSFLLAPDVGKHTSGV